MSDLRHPSGPWTLELMLESRLENVDALRRLLIVACDWCGVDEAARYAVELATVEAVTNAMRHAHLLDAGKKVRVVVSNPEGAIRIVVEDEGLSIPDEQWELASHRAQKQAAEQAREGGRGLFLIRELMDEADYDSLDGTNRWTLVKRL
ncbi:MAG: ATP-binding protein [Acidobacteriota bacterium]|nr:ATP-binding protein [Acidobacteriota bacterium]MDQ7088757.1 ATP-binding protein [Acidobacteriota bacterium]